MTEYEIEKLLTERLKRSRKFTKEEYDREKNYTITNRQKNWHLFFEGVAHTKDPAHMQFQQPTLERWNKFFNFTVPEECAVIIEGTHPIKDPDFVKDNSYEEVIKKMGDPGFAAKYAVNRGIKYHNLEPGMQSQINAVAEKFGRDISFLLFAGRAVMDYNSDTHKNGLRDYMSKYLVRFKNESEWSDYDFNFDHIEEIWKKIMGNAMIPNSIKDYVRAYNPLVSSNILGEASFYSQVYRDIKIIMGINEMFLSGLCKILIVYGSGHAVAQSAALELVLDSKKKVVE